MVLPENRKFSYVNNSGIGSESRSSLTDAMILDRQGLFILQQATQAIAEFLEIPVSIVGGIQTNYRLKQIAVSFFDTELEDIEKLQELANKLPQISANDPLWQEILTSSEVVTIRDSMKKRNWAESIWIRNYGIRAFIGVPLIAEDGDCWGCLMGMDLAPRRFTHKDIQFLRLTARWTMSELKCLDLRKSAPSLPTESPPGSSSEVVAANELFPSDDLDFNSFNQDDSSSNSISAPILDRLIGLMTQEMRNPLTSVTGMARVLNQEVYGKLNEKQKEYLNIIYDSGRYLVCLLDELVSLRSLDDRTADLARSGVDIEMLCQQVVNHLELEAHRKGQELRLSVEPGDRIVLLDKSKVYQILYHLLARTIETSDPGGVVRLHVSRKTDLLKMTLWVSHPWLGQGLTPVETFDIGDLSDALIEEPSDPPMSLERQMEIANLFADRLDANTIKMLDNLISAFKDPVSSASEPETEEMKSPIKFSRQDLGILLSWQLVRQHQGYIYLEGSPSYGCRYVIELPLI